MSDSDGDLILVVDDDADYLAQTARQLQAAGYAVLCADGAGKARELLRTVTPVVCLLDIVMPGTTGRVLCREIAETRRTGIIAVSSLDTAEHRVRMLNIGADDYLTKPYEAAELVARINALLRRIAGGSLQPSGGTAADWTHDAAGQRLVLRDGRSVALSPSENRVLGYLLANRGYVISREDLLAVSRVRQHGGAQDRSVDMLVSRIRGKIEPDPDNPVYLSTVWGRGYRLDLPEP